MVKRNIKNKAIYYLYIFDCYTIINGLGKNCFYHCYKIGITNNIKNRLMAIQNNVPFIVQVRFWAKFKNREFAQDVEDDIKKQYKRDNLKGEWFLFHDKSLDKRNKNRRTSISVVMRYIAKFNSVLEIDTKLI